MIGEPLLTAEEVAAYLQVPVSWVREHTRAGNCPAIPVGRYWRYRMSKVEAWLDSCSQPGRSIALRKAVTR